MNEHEQERSNEERRANFCGQHHANSSDLKDIKRSLFEEIKPMVYRQSGQWKILLAVIAIFMLTLWNITSKQSKQLEAVVENTASINLGITEYMASHIQESRDGFRRIVILEKLVENHEQRIDSLEKAK